MAAPIMKPSYDVFLSHSSTDKPAVESLAWKLQEAGINPFLDKWHLIPGKLWQHGLEEGLQNSRACVIFVGSEGIGPWHRQEMLVAVNRGAVDSDFRVIPVLLPGFSKPADIPSFLAQRTWVEFPSVEDQDAFHRLVSGIRDEVPWGSEGAPAKRALPYRCMAQPPEGWVPRSEYDQVLEALCSKNGDQAGRSVGITTALRGAGGFGKTALAQKLCFDERVRETYPQGILWTTMGEDLTESGRLSRVRDLIRWWTQEEAPAFESVAAAGAQLRDLLAGSRVLVVIDDAWKLADVTPFQGLRAGSALLVTTRVSQALPENSLSIPVDAMASSEAISLLQLGLPEAPRKDIESLVTRLGEWALLLKLVNGTLRKLVNGGLTVSEALQRASEYLDAGGVSAFDQNDPDSRHAAASKTILVSTRLLSEKEQDLFFRLAIFPEDENIPLSVLERYWQLSRFLARRLCDQLNDLSLLRDFAQKPESIRLHNVTRRILMDHWRGGLSSLHQDLLNLSRPVNGEWKDLPAEERYLWKRLSYHFVGAGDKKELEELLLEFSFLEAKLNATDINSLIGEYEIFVGESLEHRLVRDTLRLSAHVFTESRKQFAPQLLGRLLGRKESRLQALVEDAKHWGGEPWLCPRTRSLTQAGGVLIRTLEGHSDWVRAVAVLDSHRAVSASDDRMLRVWDLEGGQTLKILGGHSAWVRAVAVLDSHRALSASDDGTLRMWDLESGQTLKILEGHTGGVRAVAVLDGHRALSASADRTLRVWSLESGRILRTLEGHAAGVNAVAVLDGRYAISASDDLTLRVWDLESGQILKIFKGHTARINGVAVLNGSRMVSASDDRTIRVWDLESGQTLKILEGHTDCVKAVALLDGHRAVSASEDRTLRVWNLESRQVLRTLEGHSAWINAVALLEGGRAISASDDRTLRVWNLESEQGSKTFEGHSDWVRALALLDSHRAISASDDRTLRMWDLESGRTLKILAGHSAGINAVALLDDGRIVSASADQTLLVWDLESGQILKALEGHSAGVRAVALLDNGRAISGSADRTLRIWELESGQVLKALEGHEAGVNAVELLDGDRAISASADRTLRVWDLASGQTLRILEGHSAGVKAVVVLDGLRAVSASDDRTLRVWDLGACAPEIARGRIPRRRTAEVGFQRSLSVRSAGTEYLEGSKSLES